MLFLTQPLILLFLCHKSAISCQIDSLYHEQILMALEKGCKFPIFFCRNLTPFISGKMSTKCVHTLPVIP